jgi:uncharacterized lipoprotein
MKQLIIATMLTFGIAACGNAATPAKPAVDCTQKKNAKKIECKEAPKSDVKPAVKKPEKVERKAPKSVKEKAESNNSK